MYDRQSEANRAHLQTLIDLSLKALRSEVKYLQKQWPQFGKLALMFRQVGNETILKEDLMKALIRDYLDEAKLPKDAVTFNALLNNMRKTIVSLIWRGCQSLESRFCFMGKLLFQAL